jgi:hypothetical protein
MVMQGQKMSETLGWNEGSNAKLSQKQDSKDRTKVK